MKNQIIAAVAGLLVAASASAEPVPANCPDLGGHWVGSCQFKFSGDKAKGAVVRSALQRQQTESLDIIQIGAGNPLECRLLTVQGEPVTVGGIQTAGFSVPMSNGQSIAVSTSGGATWEQNRPALLTKGVGLLMVGPSNYVPFRATDLLTRPSSDRLERGIEVSGEGFSASIDCLYHR